MSLDKSVTYVYKPYRGAFSLVRFFGASKEMNIQKILEVFFQVRTRTLLSLYLSGQSNFNFPPSTLHPG